MKFHTAAIATAISLFCLNVQANVIIDTGPNTDTTVGSSIFHSPWNWQKLAGKFVLDQDYIISGVFATLSQGFISETYNVAIHREYNSAPGTKIHDVWYTQSYTNGYVEWSGPSDWALELEAGSYWVVYSSRLGLGGTGWMGNVENPLPDYKFMTNDYPNVWRNLDKNLGLQVHGTLAAVPEPSSYALMLAGIALVAVQRRKTK